jgi:signal transduction histidine kinase
MNMNAQTLYEFVCQRLWEFSSPWRDLPEISGAIGKTPAQRKIAYLQYRKNLDASPLTWFATVIGYGFWATAIWPYVDDKKYLIVWAILAVSLVAYDRIFGVVQTSKVIEDSQLRQKEKSSGRFITAVGIVWGLARLILPSNTRELDVYFFATLLFVNTASFTMFSMYRAGMLWLALPATIICVAILFLQGNGLRAILPLGFLVLMVALFRIAYKSGELMEAALISEEEKRELLDELHLRRMEADTANRAKTRFLTAASHDLRQPINSVALLLGAMREVNSTITPTLVNRMEVSIQSMDRLLNSITEASTLDSGSAAISIEPTRLMPI